MLLATLQKDQIDALKSKNSLKLTAIRYIVAQVKNKEIAKGSALTDEEVLAVIKKIERDLKESVVAFEKGNRTDLANEYKGQLAVVSAYLPPEMTDEELKTAVADLIEKNKILFEQNPKALMGISIKALKDRASTNRILAVLSSYNK